MDEEKKCLQCGYELDTIEYTDLEIDDGTTVIATVRGVCLSCGAEHYWHEKFKYTEIYGSVLID